MIGNILEEVEQFNRVQADRDSDGRCCQAQRDGIYLDLDVALAPRAGPRAENHESHGRI
jgi:hypothetical protein